MYQTRIGTYEQRKKYRYQKKNFVESVKSMVDFFEGFEYGENAVVMNLSDYKRNARFFTVKDGELNLSGIPVYVSNDVPKGKAFLTTIDRAKSV